jgi:flagellar biosynthetic protein FliR
MINFTSIQLEAWLAAFIFPLARILALVSSSPVLGNRQIPIRVKVGLSMLITFIISPILNIPVEI